jgi:hypothetical protein
MMLVSSIGHGYVGVGHVVGVVRSRRLDMAGVEYGVGVGVGVVCSCRLFRVLLIGHGFGGPGFVMSGEFAH